MNAEELTGLEKQVFEAEYTLCEFDDECSCCDNPTQGSYAIGYDNYTGEVDDYICGKCAIKGLSKLVEFRQKEHEDLVDYLSNL